MSCIFEKNITFRTIDKMRYTIEIKIDKTKHERFDFENPCRIVPIGAPILSITGAAYEYRCKNCCCCGQIQDTLEEDINNFKAKNDQDKILQLLQYWEKYHLNDLHAGTAKQEAAISEHFKDINSRYGETVEYLKSIDLYCDAGYKYGMAWLYQEIPVKELVDFFNSL